MNLINEEQPPAAHRFAIQVLKMVDKISNVVIQPLSIVVSCLPGLLSAKSSIKKNY